MALTASLLGPAPAWADCQPEPASTGQTVTCSGIDNNGFQAGAAGQLTVNVQTGAAVNFLAPNSTAIQLNNTNVVTNNGAVNAGDDGTGISAVSGNVITNASGGAITVGNSVNATAFGIVVVDGNLVTNFGSIQLGTTTSCGCGVVGISANNGNFITNVGPISGGDLGVGIAVADGNTVINRGAISFGLNSAGITGGNNNTITNDVSGTITLGDSLGLGAVAGILVQSNNTITNLGVIRMGSGAGFGLPMTGIFAFDTNLVINAGPIIGGNFSAGIYSHNGNSITNLGSITLGQDSVGIFGRNGNNITNAAGAMITVGDSTPFGLGTFGISVHNNNTVTNLGTIVVGNSCGCSSPTGIDVGSGNAVVNGGTIVGGNLATGINAIDGNNITNSGAIRIGDNSPFGPAAGIAVFDNNTITNAAGGTITTGLFGIGIAAHDNNIVTNNGLINVGAGGIGVLLDSSNAFTNNGTVRAGASGASIFSCGACTQNNTVVNNGTLDGQIALLGTSHSLTNNGLITVTDPGTPLGVPHEVDGTFLQSASGTLALRVSPDTTPGRHDALSIFAGAPTDTATLGGTLKAVIQPGLYQSTQTYTDVATFCSCFGGTFTGTFASVVSSSPFFNATAIYGPNNVDLTLNRIPFGSVPGETQNQRNVGNYLEQNYSTGLTGNAATFFSLLLTSPSLGVLDKLSGEGTTGTQQTTFNAGSMFGKAMLDQVLSFLDGGVPGTGDFNPESTLLQYAATEKVKRPEYKAFAAIRPEAGAFRPRPWRGWMTAFGGTQSLNGDAVIGSADASNRTFGVAGGFDYQVSPDLLVGFGAAGTSSDFSVPGRATNGTLDGTHLGLYGVYRWGAAYLAGTLSYSHFNNDTTRTISGVGPTETAKGQFGSDQFGGRLQVGRKFAFDRFTVTPFAAVQYLQLWQRGYTEASFTGAGAPGILGLSFQSRAVSSLPTFLGAQVDTRIAFAHGVTFVPFVRASWVHEFMPDRSIAAAMSMLPTGTFIADGPRAASDAARIEAGSNLYVTRNVAFFGNFVGEYSSRTSSSAGNGGLRVNW